MKIKAAILEACNKPLVIYHDITPPALKPGQVMCHIKYAGLCHSQLMEVKGHRGKDNYLPHMLGHEGVGEVVEIGPAVTKFRPGDRVILGWIKGEGIDAGGSVYHHPSGELNAGAVTTFSNYSIVSENRLVPLPPLMDEKSAVLLGCALPTGVGIVLNQLKPKQNSSILVLGLGGIGLSALLALLSFSPEAIVAVDVEEHKLDLAQSFGATHCFKANDQGVAEFKQAFPQGVDYAVESAGQVSTIELAFSMLKQQGMCIFASHPPNGHKITIDPHELICGKQLIGSWGGGCRPDIDVPLISDIIRKHQLPVERLLSKEYPLESINQALADLENRVITRALITTD